MSIGTEGDMAIYQPQTQGRRMASKPMAAKPAGQPGDHKPMVTHTPPAPKGGKPTPAKTTPIPRSNQSGCSSY